MSSNSKTSNKSTADRASKQTSQMTARNVFTRKNKILTDLTRAIQLVQKSFLETDRGVSLTFGFTAIKLHLTELFNYLKGYQSTNK